MRISFITHRLINDEGAILAKTGEYNKENLLGAIMINIWDDYLEIGREVLRQKDMTTVIVNTATSRILAQKIVNVVLLMKANKQVDIGMLRAKAQIISNLLEGDFKKLETANKSEEVKS